MAPKKLPLTLLQSSLNVVVTYARNICEDIASRDGRDSKCFQKIKDIKKIVYSFVPGRFCISIYDQLESVIVKLSAADLYLLAHPLLTHLTKEPNHEDIQECMWLELLPTMTNLVALNLEGTCTDEILSTIASNCVMLEELNALPKYDISVYQKVTNTGLSYLSSLVHLKILVLDRPMDNVRKSPVITSEGVRRLLLEVPSLEELNLAQYDIIKILLTIPPTNKLQLKRIKNITATRGTIRKLSPICPSLTALNLEADSYNEANFILGEIAESDVSLQCLQLLFFSFSFKMVEMLSAKGHTITSLSLVEIEPELAFHSIVVIGQSCPNISTLYLKSLSELLHVSQEGRDSYIEERYFGNLTDLTLCLDTENFIDILMFFIKSAVNMKKLHIHLDDHLHLDDLFIPLMKEGFLKYLECLSIHPFSVLSVETLKFIINVCEQMRLIRLDDSQQTVSILSDYTRAHNLDVVIKHGQWLQERG